MKLQQEIDHSTLSWVKNELDLTLKQAIEALEAYSEDRDDSSQMRFCATYLHQVQGTLRMVELYGAALLVEEMEQLAVDLLEGKVDDEEAAFEVLMRGMVQLPDYLDRLLSGHKDIPVVFLPLVNEIRALRGESLATEGALFNPDLSLGVPEDLPCPPRRYADKVLRPNIARLRAAYQVGLLKWFRDGASEDLYRRMGLLFERLLSVSTQPVLRQLFWITGGVVEALQNNALELSNSVKSLFGKVDVELRNLALHGERHFVHHRPESVINNLLYYVAQAEPGGLLVDRIKAHYGLDALLPREEDVEHARGTMSGHNREVLSSVGSVLKEELLGVKEQLDLMLRKPETTGKALAELLPVLQKVRETLAMLGIGYAQSTVEDQIQRIEALKDSEEAVQETDLLEIAGSLLTVESALDDHIQNLGQVEEEDEPAAHQLPNTEVQQLLEGLIKEANNNLAQVKESLVSFIEAPWDHRALAGLPEKLEEVSGALRMLEMEEPAVIMRGVGQYVQEDLLDRQQIPSTRQLELLADAIAGMEYFMEALAERRSPGNVLSHIASALEALREEEPAAKPAPVAEVEEADDSLDFSEDLLPEVPDAPEPDMGLAEDSGDGEAEETTEAGTEDGLDLPSFAIDEEPVEQEEPVAESEEAREYSPAEEAAEAAPEAGAAETPAAPVALELPEAAKAIEIPPASEAEDADLLEVFIEEIEEEKGNLQTQLEAWKADPENQEALAAIRRSFHTLKGSGRLIGAKRTGEFSWHVENMLNRLIEGSIERSPELLGLLEVIVAQTIPGLHAQLVGQGAGPEEDVLRLQMYMADQLAENQPVDPNWLAMLAGGAPGKPEAGPEPHLEEEDTPDAAAPGEADQEVEVPAEQEEAESVAVADEPGDEVEPGQPQVDEELLAIFEAEARNHLDELKRWLEETPPGGQVSEAARVASHTLNGAASMTEIPAIASLTAPLEGVLKRLHNLGAVLEAPVHELLEQTLGVLDLQVQQLVDGLPLEAADDLRDRLEALKAELPEHAPAEPVSEADEPEEEEWTIDVADVEGELSTEAPVEESGPAEAGQGDSDFTLDDLDLDKLDELDLEIGDEHDVLAELDQATEALGEMEIELADEPVEETAPEPGFDTIPEADADSPTVDDSDVSSADGEEDTLFTADELARASAELEEALQPPVEDEASDSPAAEPALAETREDVAPEETEIEVQAAGETVLESDEEPADAALEEADEQAEAVPSTGTPESFADTVPETPVEDVEEAGETVPVEAEQAEPDTEATTEPLQPPEPAPDEQPVSEAAAADDTDETPEPLSLDPELASIFLEEAEDVAGELDRALEQWQQDAKNREPVDALQRSLHTLKGGARTIGLDSIGELAHQMESVLMAIQQEAIEPSEQCVEIETRAFDHLQENIDRVRQGVQPQIDQALLEQLRQLARGVEAAPAVEAEQRREELLQEQQAEAEEASEQPESEQPEQAAPATLGRAPSSVVRPKPPRKKEEVLGKQELVRVRSDLLGKLVNFAGEVSIYRSRLEQQMGDFRFNLDELQQTVVRLRDQLRKLEIETEAQILSRYQREHELDDSEDEEFDPLELDRFSTLQQLSRALSESVNDLVSIQETLEQLTRESETLLLQQSRVSTELQEGLMQTRMVSFDTLVPRLRRIVRQTAQELGKKAVLRVEGTEGEMDRNILERITAPLEHTLRNAVAHGIETPEERQALGKPEQGEVRIRVSRDATDVVLEISDDGAGIDTEKVRAKAIQQGLIAEDADLSEQEIFSLIMESGFSTAESVSQIAGRGVGMDVVSTELKQLGGTITIDSERGKGSRFIIRLPFTLAVTQSILVKVSDSTYAIPLASVEGVVRMPVKDFEELMREEPPEIVYGGREHPVRILAEMMGLPEAASMDMIQVPILIVRAGDQSLALKVDGIVGNREIVVKPVGPQISTIAGIFGATIMGDGSVVLILDVGALARQGKMLVHRPQMVEAEREKAALQRKPVIMVVDDSITMRKVTSRVLERQDMEVFTAKDGLDALEQLQERQPDVMLLDIEMPRMDGYELATHMRNDERLKQIPIIMITSRTGEKHRQRALELGVQKYLGKPYQEEDLLREVKDCLEQRVH